MNWILKVHKIDGEFGTSKERKRGGRDKDDGKMFIDIASLSELSANAIDKMQNILS